RPAANWLAGQIAGRWLIGVVGCGTAASKCSMGSRSDLGGVGRERVCSREGSMPATRPKAQTRLTHQPPNRPSRSTDGMAVEYGPWSGHVKVRCLVAYFLIIHRGY